MWEYEIIMGGKAREGKKLVELGFIKDLGWIKIEDV